MMNTIKTLPTKIFYTLTQRFMFNSKIKEYQQLTSENKFLVDIFFIFYLFTMVKDVYKNIINKNIFRSILTSVIESYTKIFKNIQSQLTEYQQSQVRLILTYLSYIKDNDITNEYYNNELITIQHIYDFLNSESNIFLFIRDFLNIISKATKDVDISKIHLPTFIYSEDEILFSIKSYNFNKTLNTDNISNRPFIKFIIPSILSIDDNEQILTKKLEILKCFYFPYLHLSPKYGMNDYTIYELSYISSNNDYVLEYLFTICKFINIIDFKWIQNDIEQFIINDINDKYINKMIKNRLVLESLVIKYYQLRNDINQELILNSSQKSSLESLLSEYNNFMNKYDIKNGLVLALEQEQDDDLESDDDNNDNNDDNDDNESSDNSPSNDDNNNNDQPSTNKIKRITKYVLDLAKDNEPLEDYLMKLSLYSQIRELLYSDQGKKLSSLKYKILKTWINKWIFLVSLKESKKLLKELNIKLK